MKLILRWRDTLQKFKTLNQSSNMIGTRLSISPMESLYMCPVYKIIFYFFWPYGMCMK